jgi:dienelactone hydrolase
MNTQHPECCPPGSHGRAASHYLNAKGQMEKWTLAGNEIDVYTVGPADAHTTVVAVVDIFGIHEGRIKGCCDFLAERGHRVILPDFHKGDSIVMEDGFMAKLGDWLGAHPIDEVVEMVKETCNKVRQEGKKLVTIGFCWGTWVQYRAM